MRPLRGARAAALHARQSDWVCRRGSGFARERHRGRRWWQGGQEHSWRCSSCRQRRGEVRAQFRVLVNARKATKLRYRGLVLRWWRGVWLSAARTRGAAHTARAAQPRSAPEQCQSWGLLCGKPCVLAPQSMVCMPRLVAPQRPQPTQDLHVRAPMAHRISVSTALYGA